MTRASIFCVFFLPIGCAQPIAQQNKQSKQDERTYSNPVFPALADREAVARVLPSVGPDQLTDLSAGVEIVQVGTRKWRKVTLEEKLGSLGAKVVAGKLVDRHGKPIFFWITKRYGNIRPGQLEQDHEVFERLRKEGTIIEIHYWRDAEKGAPPPIVCQRSFKLSPSTCQPAAAFQLEGADGFALAVQLDHFS